MEAHLSNISNRKKTVLPTVSLPEQGGNTYTLTKKVSLTRDDCIKALTKMAATKTQIPWTEQDAEQLENIAKNIRATLTLPKT